MKVEYFELPEPFAALQARVPRGTVFLLTGQPGSGKTTGAYRLAAALAGQAGCGVTVFDFENSFTPEKFTMAARDFPLEKVEVRRGGLDGVAQHVNRLSVMGRRQVVVVDPVVDVGYMAVREDTAALRSYISTVSSALAALQRYVVAAGTAAILTSHGRSLLGDALRRAEAASLAEVLRNPARFAEQGDSKLPSALFVPALVFTLYKVDRAVAEKLGFKEPVAVLELSKNRFGPEGGRVLVRLGSFEAVETR